MLMEKIELITDERGHLVSGVLVLKKTKHKRDKRQVKVCVSSMS